MNTINDSQISFQAKLVSPLKGRNNSMIKLKTVFENISKKYDGTLVIDRNNLYFGKPYPIFAYVGELGMSVGDEMRSFLSLKNPTHRQVREMAYKVLNTLKTLQAEETYNKATEEIESSIGTAIKRCTRERNKANFYHNATLAEILQSNIDKLSLEKETKMQKIQKKFIKKLNLHAPKSLDANYGEYTKYDLKINR